MPFKNDVLRGLDPFPALEDEACRTEAVHAAHLRRWAVAAMVLFLCTEAVDPGLVLVQGILAFACCIATTVTMVIGAVYVRLRAS